MNIEQSQIPVNVSDLCYEVDPNDYLDSKQFIKPMESIVLYENGAYKNIFKGPRVVNLEDYQKKTRNSDNSEIRLFYINEEKLIINNISSELDFSSFDFLLRILMNLKVGYSFNMKIKEYDKFIELILPTKRFITTERLQDIIVPIIQYSLRRNLLSLIREKNASFLDATKYLLEINDKINDDIVDRVGKHGIYVDFKLQNINFDDSGSILELKEIMLKAKEMEVLNYSYKEEYFTDYVLIVDEEEVKK